ncbi:hypothetical protein D3C73_852540 [compost metagenome]
MEKEVWAMQNLTIDKKKIESFGALSYQFTPIAIRYGNKIGIYGEFGFGYLGIANVGISLKL